jgi:hypothetical protein
MLHRIDQDARRSSAQTALHCEAKLNCTLFGLYGNESQALHGLMMPLQGREGVVVKQSLGSDLVLCVNYS